MVLGIWLNAADGLVTVTLMPSVARDLGGVAYFGWAVAIFLTASILAGASAGQLSRRAGLRLATLVAAAAYVAGCAFSAASSDILGFLAGRAMQGLGSGWIIGFCYVAIEAAFPERLWARLLAAAAAAWGVASLVGPLIGGLFAAGGHWRGAFWMFAVQGGVFAVASGLLLPARRETAPRSSLAWRTLATLATAIGLVAAADLDPDPWTALALVAAGLAVFVAALRVNGLPGERLLPRDAGRPATVAGAGYAMIFLMEVGTVGANVYEAAVLQTAYGVTPLVAGYVVCTLAMGWTAAAFAVSGAPDHRHGQIIRVGASLIVAGSVLLAVTIARTPLWTVAAAAAVIGAGFGLCWSLLARRIVGGLDGEDRALGAGAIPTTQLIGGAVGAALSGALANLLGLSRDFSELHARAAAPWLFAAFVPVVAVGLAAAFRIAGASESRRPPAG